MNAVRELVAKLSPRLLGSQPGAAGLHIVGDRLYAAQMQAMSGTPSLYAVGSLDLGCPWYGMLREPRRFKHVLKRFWAEHGFRGSDVVAAMPQEQLKVFTVDYAAAQGQPDAQAIATEVKDRLKGKPGPLVVDFVPIRQATSGERTKEALVAVAGRDDVTGFLDFIGGAGLTVRVLDIPGMALRRLVPLAAKDPSEQAQNALVLHIGTACSQLMLVLQGELVLDRSIEFSEQRLVSRVARLLELPEPQARRLLMEQQSPTTPSPQLAELERVLREIAGSELVALKAEISKTLEYAASKTRGNGVDKVVLVGAFAGLPAIGQFLRSAFAKPVERLEPLSLFPQGLTTAQTEVLASQGGGVAVAIGLALRGIATP